jgi:hypothetical protein
MARARKGKSGRIGNWSKRAYNEFVKKSQVVIDTNVLIAALRSKNGASHKLLLLIGGHKYNFTYLCR